MSFLNKFSHFSKKPINYENSKINDEQALKEVQSSLSEGRLYQLIKKSEKKEEKIFGKAVKNPEDSPSFKNNLKNKIKKKVGTIGKFNKITKTFSKLIKVKKSLSLSTDFQSLKQKFPMNPSSEKALDEYLKARQGITKDFKDGINKLNSDLEKKIQVAENSFKEENNKVETSRSLELKTLIEDSSQRKQLIESNLENAEKQLRAELPLGGEEPNEDTIQRRAEKIANEIIEGKQKNIHQKYDKQVHELQNQHAKNLKAIKNKHDNSFENLKLRQQDNFEHISKGLETNLSSSIIFKTAEDTILKVQRRLQKDPPKSFEKSLTQIAEEITNLGDLKKTNSLDSDQIDKLILKLKDLRSNMIQETSKAQLSHLERINSLFSQEFQSIQMYTQSADAISGGSGDLTPKKAEGLMHFLKEKLPSFLNRMTSEMKQFEKNFPIHLFRFEETTGLAPSNELIEAKKIYEENFNKLLSTTSKFSENNLKTLLKGLEQDTSFKTINATIQEANKVLELKQNEMNNFQKVDASPEIFSERKKLLKKMTPKKALSAYSQDIQNIFNNLKNLQLEKDTDKTLKTLTEYLEQLTSFKNEIPQKEPFNQQLILLLSKLEGKDPLLKNITKKNYTPSMPEIASDEDLDNLSDEEYNALIDTQIKNFKVANDLLPSIEKALQKESSFDYQNIASELEKADSAHFQGLSRSLSEIELDQTEYEDDNITHRLVGFLEKPFHSLILPYLDLIKGQKALVKSNHLNEEAQNLISEKELDYSFLFFLEKKIKNAESYQSKLEEMLEKMPDDFPQKDVVMRKMEYAKIFKAIINFNK